VCNGNKLSEILPLTVNGLWLLVVTCQHITREMCRDAVGQWCLEMHRYGNGRLSADTDYRPIIGASLMVFVKAVRNQMAPPCVEWWAETNNQATTPVGYCPNTASFPVRSHCMNARWNRYHEDLNSFPLGELEETTRTPSYYMDEDYATGREIQQPSSESEALDMVQNHPLWRLMSMFGATCS